jgi:predicted MPP superfamily phosphohydrolase
MWQASLRNTRNQNISIESFDRERDKRLVWAITRSLLENNTYKRKRYGGNSKSHWPLFVRLAHIFGFILKLSGLYDKGQGNAKDIKVKNVVISFADLPASFDSYRILHLTDLHLDSISGIETIICEKIRNLRYDLCVMTGDYRERIDGGFKEVLTSMRRITSAIKAGDGILATLGNHDTYLMVEHLEKMGIRILANETAIIYKKTEGIAVTGVDDPHYYFTDQAVSSLERETAGFKVVLAHSPELYDLAAVNGYNLYLCGHTHGGQICLPGGIPIFTHLHSGRRFYKGLWSYSNMRGYTSQGCGVVALPLRFNTHGEIALITLKKVHHELD